METEAIVLLTVLVVGLYLFMGMGFHNLIRHHDKSPCFLNVLLWPIGMVFCAFNEKHLET